MDWYEAEVSELVRRLAAQPVAAPAVFYGSSTITLWESLARDLGCDRAVNAGFGGSTLEACVYFFDRIVPPLEPRALVLYAGDNDLGDGRSFEEIAASFHAMTDLVDRHMANVPFGFISVKPSPARESLLARIREVNDFVRDQMERRPHGYFIDVFSAMLSEGKPRPELFGDDGLHLNRAGYEVWMRALAPYRDRYCPPATV